MYHNIAPNSAPLGHKMQGITLTESVFNWQIKILSRFFKIISLQDYIENKNSGHKMSFNTIAITIDDGTWQTYNIGSFIWNKFKTPVTIFVNTCQIDQGPLIWGGYLNALCFENLYECVDVFEYKLPLISKKDQIETKRKLHKLSLEFGNQHVFFLDLQKKYPLTNDIFNYYKGMSSEQLRNSTEDSLVTIGAHTHSHPSLDLLSYNDQKKEIETSKTILEQILNRNVNSFAYPSGLYNDETIRILMELNFKNACAVVPKKINRAIDKFELPRVGIYRKDKLGFILLLLRGIFK